MEGYERYSMGQRIHDLRKSSGKSQEELAAEIGELRENIKHWENGTRQLKDEKIIKLAKYFNVSADYILGLRKEKTADITAQGVIEYTGLSEKAINKLHFAMSGYKAATFAEYIDRLIGSEYFLLLISCLFALEETKEIDKTIGTGKYRGKEGVALTVHTAEELREKYEQWCTVYDDLGKNEYLTHDALNKIIKDICRDLTEYRQCLEEEISGIAAEADRLGIDMRRENNVKG